MIAVTVLIMASVLPLLAMAPMATVATVVATVAVVVAAMVDVGAGALTRLDVARRSSRPRRG